MKTFTASLAMLAMAATAAQAQDLSNLRLGIVLGYESEIAAAANPQEKAALDWIKAACPQVKVYTSSDVASLSNQDVDAVWVHADRMNIESGWQNLPAAFSGSETVQALKDFYEAGGSLLLTKHATQLATAIGAIDKEVNVFGAGDGGDGSDNWTIQATLGAAEEFESLDRSSHPIYSGMSTNTDFGHESFPLLGTGDPATSLWREDHNCFWIPADLGFGSGNNDVNCIKEFENAYNCQVLGTWGHVTDYCGAGIIDFASKTADNARIIAIGLAAYELAPRNGGNAFTSNIDKLTGNSLRYLANSTTSGVAQMEVSTGEAAPAYYTLQGLRIDKPAAGQVCIERRGAKATKVIF